MRTTSSYLRARALLLTVAVMALAMLPTAAQAAPKKVFLRFSTSAYSVVESHGTATVTVLRSGNTKAPVTVDYATANGTAHAGSEYADTHNTLSFAAGETRKSFTVPIVDNAVAGPASKKFTVSLSHAVSLSQTQLKFPSTATVTILDDDGPGTIDFSSASYGVVESAGVATITVNRFSASNLVETVDYATSNGTALADSDYTDTHGTLTFAIGEMSKTFQVPITDDESFEGDEGLAVTLSNPKNLTTPDQPVLGSNTPATLTIVDDDVPTFTFDQPTYSVFENAGHATITVDRGGDTTIPASVDYATSDGTAQAGTDYTDSHGQLDFAAGETSKTFQVPITDDLVGDQPNKTIGLHLTQNGDEVDTALLSIVDDDPGIPSVQFSDATYSVNESATTATLTVTLSHAPTSDVTVHYTTADGVGATAATAGSPPNNDGGADYIAIVNHTLTFHAGETSKTIDVTLNPDTVAEDDETFTVSLVGLSGAVGGAPSQAAVTIVDDDSTGTLEFSALRYDANESSGHATLTVRRIGGSAGAASVDYATSDGTARAPGDYTATSGTLNFADGETQKTFDIPIAWDGLAEGDETVSIGLTNFVSDDDPDASKAAVLHIADAGASGPVQFSATSYDAPENGGPATITVTRSGGLGGPVTVHYATADGTAHAGTDYTESHGTLTFGPGETSKTFQVPLTDDNIREGGRTVTLTLSNPGGGTALGGQATAALNITDDEPVTSASTDKTAPKLKLTAKKLQKALTTKRLVIKVRSNEAAKLAVAITLRKGNTSKLVAIAKASKKVGADKTVTIKIKLSKKALAKLRAAVVNGRVKLRVTVKGTDAARNGASVSKTVTIR